MQAFPQCVFDHWELMTPDPLQSGSQTNEIVLNIRKRKGARALAAAADAGRVAHTRAAGWGVRSCTGTWPGGGRRRPAAAGCPTALHPVWLHHWHAVLLFSLPFTMQASSPSRPPCRSTRVSRRTAWVGLP